MLSRDGTRLVAAGARRAGGDRLLVARVQRDAKGRVRGSARPPAAAADRRPGDRIRDVGLAHARHAWRSWSGPTAGTSQVLLVEVDGSSDAARTSAPTSSCSATRAVRLVASPAAGAPLLRRHRRPASSSRWPPTGRWTGDQRSGRASRAPTFVG